MPTYAKFEPISLKGHPELNERWVQDRIAEDPSILGLGDVILKDKERIQPRAGRLEYEHTAAIVAENITARFLNVISLFNGMIPLVAIQTNALKLNDQVGLVFTKVLDQMTLGLVEEDEEVQETTDRAYWIERGSQKTISMCDELLEYNKFYIGLAKNGQPCNFVAFCVIVSQ